MRWSTRHLFEVLTVLAVLIAGTAALGYEPVPARALPADWIDTNDREEVLAFYRAEFWSNDPELEWQGDHEHCDAGTSSAEYRLATLDRVNYYRAMAGVVAGVTEEVLYTDKAQDAAMMMSVEGELTHSPSSTFACFSPTGQEAAANSNLYLGRTGPSAIDGYIEDPGDRNTDVGHRNTILHPPTRKMGVGDVDSSLSGYAANALWVFDDRVFAMSAARVEGAEELAPMREPDRFVSWPPRGFVPAELVHPRWSFTMAGVDLSEAEVTMYLPSADEDRRQVPLEVVSRTGAPGHVPLPTIVWEPELIVEGEADMHALVVITGVDGPSNTYSYTVRIIGDEPIDELTMGEFLDRIGRQANR